MSDANAKAPSGPSLEELELLAKMAIGITHIAMTERAMFASEEDARWVAQGRAAIAEVWQCIVARIGPEEAKAWIRSVDAHKRHVELRVAAAQAYARRGDA